MGGGSTHTRAATARARSGCNRRRAPRTSRSSSFWSGPPGRVPRTMSSLDWADRNWPLLRRLMGGHAAIYRLTGGLIGHWTPGAAPTLLLDHVGAKSGTKRTSPLSYIRDGDSYVLVA